MNHKIKGAINSLSEVPLAGAVIVKIKEIAWRRNKTTNPPKVIKQKIVRNYGKKYNIKVFVETGTYVGDMIEAVKNDFEKIYSIELSDELYKNAVARFKGDKKITLYNGDSAFRLAPIVDMMDVPILYWLDAHYSGYKTAKSSLGDTPITNELEAIFSKWHRGNVILIDDARLFNGTDNYPTIEHLRKYLASKNQNLSLKVADDIIRVTNNNKHSMKSIVHKLRKVFFSACLFKDYKKYSKIANNDATRREFSMKIRDMNPQLFDKTASTGFDRHYVYHTSWAARVLAEIKPAKHVDISSSLYFAGIVSAFIKIDFYDYRPANLNLSNLDSKHGDLQALPFEDSSIPSISCMHTIEHVGLGRYGDPIDPDGDIKAVKELKRVVSRSGSILFVVPIGENPVIEFNAHRIYTYNQVISMFSGLTLKEFALIPENEARGGLIRNASPESIRGERYACGCFWFIK